jgi:hypothetical protein
MQESLHSSIPSSADFNATFDSNLPIGPEIFPYVREVNLGGDTGRASSNTQSPHTGFQDRTFNGRDSQPSTLGTMQTTATPNISVRLSNNQSAPEAIPWGQDAAHPRNNVVGTSNVDTHAETQYADPADNFDTGASFDYDIEPDSIAALLGSELAAVTIRPTGIRSKSELADMSRELYPPSGDSWEWRDGWLGLDIHF